MTTNTIPFGSKLRHWIAVPAVSFGGIGIELLLASVGFPYAVWAGIAGCVAASCVLCYQAYLKPRRDLVSLFTPLFAFLIFIMPNDISSGVIVQTLFAATITFLAIRVEKLFNATKPQERTMKDVLNEYIARIEPLFAVIDEETGHLIAQSLLTYKFELYGSAAEKMTAALARLDAITPHPGAVERALLILRERTGDLADSRVTANPEHTFTEADYDNLAIRLRPDQIEDPAALDLDNALVLLYAVGIETSPDDEQALEEHQRFVIQILESYKDKLTL
jgi:Ca2+/Na+ antiporter